MQVIHKFRDALGLTIEEFWQDCLGIFEYTHRRMKSNLT